MPSTPELDQPRHLGRIVDRPDDHPQAVTMRAAHGRRRRPRRHRATRRRSPRRPPAPRRSPSNSSTSSPPVQGDAPGRPRRMVSSQACSALRQASAISRRQRPDRVQAAPVERLDRRAVARCRRSRPPRPPRGRTSLGIRCQLGSERRQLGLEVEAYRAVARLADQRHDLGERRDPAPSTGRCSG